jgi:hypothetical protein
MTFTSLEISRLKQSGTIQAYPLQAQVLGRAMIAMVSKDFVCVGENNDCRGG